LTDVFFFFFLTYFSVFEPTYITSHSNFFFAFLESAAPFGLAPSHSQSFADPAIMAAQFAPAPAAYNHGPMGYGPPPGLSYGAPPGILQHPSQHGHGGAESIEGNGSAHGEFISVFIEGREVSVPSAVLSQCGKSIIGIEAIRPILTPAAWTPSLFSTGLHEMPSSRQL
jgi:hypothetical protein